MTDKEVGGLWNWLDGVDDDVMALSKTLQDMVALIRKLVDERARYDSRQCGCLGVEHTALHIANALRDFGIVPVAWK